jgi:hypothetical protein
MVQECGLFVDHSTISGDIPSQADLEAMGLHGEPPDIQTVR